jgi:tetratricopeptide (TPR) repeat protein
VTEAPAGGPYEWWQRALELLDRGDAAAAAVLLERAVEVDPVLTSGWEALGRASYDAGQLQRAAEAFARLVELAPDSHYGHFALGLTLTRLDRFERGVEHLAMACVMRPERAEYADRLRQARATLRARRDASRRPAGAAADGADDADEADRADAADDA